MKKLLCATLAALAVCALTFGQVRAQDAVPHDASGPDVDRRALIQRALDVLSNSYAPCSDFNAAAAEGERRIRAIVIAGGAKGLITDYCPPCGVCRQVMREFGSPENTFVIMAKTPDDYVEMTLEQLLPLSFGPDSLK